MKLKQLLIPATAVILMTSVFLAGCGSQNASTSTNTPTNTSANTPAATQKGATSEDKTYTIKVAHYFAANHPLHIAMVEKFKPLVEKNSNGTLKIELYENSKLGADQAIFDGVRSGTIEMGLSGMLVQSVAEKMAAPEFPFLFKDFKHAKKVLQGPLGKIMTDDLESKAGVHAVAWTANGFRMISSNKPLQTMQDFKGFRLRMPNTPTYLALGKAFGANVTPMAISEVFTALESKVVDGQDNPIATVRSSGWFEVQKYELESRHMFSPNIFMMNGKLWDKLSAGQKKVIEDAAKATADYEWDLLENSEASDKKFLEDKGMKFITPDDKFKAELEASIQPIYEDYYKKYPWAKDLVQKIKAEAK